MNAMAYLESDADIDDDLEIGASGAIEYGAFQADFTGPRGRGAGGGGGRRERALLRNYRRRSRRESRSERALRRARRDVQPPQHADRGVRNGEPAPGPDIRAAARQRGTGAVDRR